MHRTRIGFLGGVGAGAALMYALYPRVRSGAPGVSDRMLADRVRAALARAVSHPGAIQVEVQGSRVILSGQVFESESSELLRRVNRVAGVGLVVDRLARHRALERMPARQAAGRTPRRGLERDVWPPAWRLAAASAGLGAGVYGLGRGGIIGKALVVGGGALLTRAVTNQPVSRLSGVGGGRRMIELSKTLLVHAPIDEVYSFWTHVGNFPRFMEHVHRVVVSQDNPRRSHWEVRGPGGVTMSWDAEVTRTVPDEMFAWKTLPGSGVEHAGTVQFGEMGDDSTRVHVRMSYRPPAGALGHAVASMLGADPRSRMDEDLARLKSLLEDGRTRARGHAISRDEVSDPLRF